MSAEEPGLTARTADLVVPCGPRGATTLTADWYLPEAAPAAVVWLQHGFTRSRGKVAGLARALAAATGCAVVAPTVSSTFATAHGVWINGSALHEGVAVLLADGFDALDASAGTHLPRALVLTGLSAGGNLALAVAGHLAARPSAEAELRGVVLFDAVERKGSMARALASLDRHRPELPVGQIAAPSSMCNARSSGTRALQAHRGERAFVGLRLTKGSHLDAENPPGHALDVGACGKGATRNAAALRALASGWVTDAVTGTRAGVYDPAAVGVPAELL